YRRPRRRGEDAQSGSVLDPRNRRAAGSRLRIGSHGGRHCPYQGSPGHDGSERCLNTAKTVGAVTSCTPRKQARHANELHAQTRSGLQVVPVEKSRGRIERIGALHVTVDQKVFPRNESFIENQYRVVFVEAAREWVIEWTVRVLFIRRPADQSRTRSIHGG